MYVLVFLKAHKKGTFYYVCERLNMFRGVDFYLDVGI